MVNNKLIFIIASVIVLAGVGYFWMQNARETQAPTTEDVAMEKSVLIEGFKFSPATIKVKVGETVTWTNKDSVAHTATGDNSEFDTGLIAKGESKSVTFEKAGNFSYHCTPHPNMKATIIVE